MKRHRSLRRAAQDQTLRWTMRVVGLVLAISSAVFLNQDIFTSEASTWFFGLCIGLGLVTALTSWLPDAKTRLQEEPVVRPVPRPIDRYRKPM